ncbi:Uncharacterised protein [Mycobacteroides abscessus subsp. abscessus]|nr:Uncharacterised protein [Mycobacteroides abscessus subsp. abscessus]
MDVVPALDEFVYDPERVSRPAHDIGVGQPVQRYLDPVSAVLLRCDAYGLVVTRRQGAVDVLGDGDGQ